MDLFSARSWRVKISETWKTVLSDCSKIFASINKHASTLRTDLFSVEGICIFPKKKKRGGGGRFIPLTVTVLHDILISCTHICVYNSIIRYSMEQTLLPGEEQCFQADIASLARRNTTFSPRASMRSPRIIQVLGKPTRTSIRHLFLSLASNQTKTDIRLDYQLP